MERELIAKNKGRYSESSSGGKAQPVEGGVTMPLSGYPGEKQNVGERETSRSSVNGPPGSLQRNEPPNGIKSVSKERASLERRRETKPRQKRMSFKSRGGG